MTRYEYLISCSERALETAKSLKDVNLKKFYLNASKGFVIKAMKLTIEEAQEEV